MDETLSITLARFQDIVAATQRIQNFPSSGELTGMLLKTLATSKLGGMFLPFVPQAQANGMYPMRTCF